MTHDDTAHVQLDDPLTFSDLTDLAARAGIGAEHVIPYGREVAKIDLAALGQDHESDSASTSRAQSTGTAPSAPPAPGANYVVVTAMTPTPFGEGKTTTAIGLAQGLIRIDQKAVLTLRQGAMGPTFGIKGGAAGSGRARILPADRVGLHLTGDFHAVTAAHNLLAAIIDNHLHHGNALGIEERTITWPRVLDVNDRSLRHIVTGLGAKADGVTRQASFDITPASEVMVILSLASDLADLRERLGRIVIGRSHDGDWVTAEDLGAAGAMCAILREALQPNLVRTGEGVPVLLHTGPFGNIATGCSSIIADRLAVHGMRHGGYVLTEAGFGTDMGLERFIDLKCAQSGMRPSVAVLVVSVRALKAHSGRYRVVSGKDLPQEMLAESPQDVREGATNMLAHLEIVRRLGLSPVVAINVFPTDHGSEIDEVERIARQAGARVAACRPVTEGGAGCTELARAVVETCQEAASAPAPLQPLYRPQDDLRTKIGSIAAMYGADGVDCTPAATRLLEAYEAAGYGDLPVLVAKTPLSLSAEPGLKGAPTGWRLPVREVRLAAGAGYVYAVCGSLSTMPGLPTRPAAERIDIDTATGQVLGLR